MCTRGSLGAGWTRALSSNRPGACGPREGIPTAVSCPAVCPAPPAPRPASDSGSEAQPEVFLSARVTPARAAVGRRAARITREAGPSEARRRRSRLLGTPLGQRDREILQLEALEGRTLGAARLSFWRAAWSQPSGWAAWPASTVFTDKAARPRRDKQLMQVSQLACGRDHLTAR